MKIVLLTGFEPFNGEPVNPAWEAVQALDGWQADDLRVLVRQLPCVFIQAPKELRAAIDLLKPDVVICVGQAGGRAELSIERVAINVDDAPLADNRQAQPIDQPVVAGAPAAYFSTLPIKAIVAALRKSGIPASVSQTAGTFVCNHVFYALMHHVAETGARGLMQAGFIHVPYLPEQAARHPGAASMGLAQIVEGLKIAVDVSGRVQRDVLTGGGKLD